MTQTFQQALQSDFSCHEKIAMGKVVFRNAGQSQPSPRPVYCVNERAYQNRGVAEEVCLGRFTHNGVPCDLGLEPDWLGATLPTDEEWRIEWSKFYYGLNLAHAFVETGASWFLFAWRRLVHSWILQVPVDYDSSDVIGRRVQNWIYAWQMFASTPHFPGFCEDFATELLASISAQAQYLRNHLTPERNHRTLELYALFIVALAFPHIDPDRALLNFSMSELYQNAITDMRGDGVHREGSTHYHCIVLRSLLGARENARRFSFHFPEDYDVRLERACEFALHCRRPDGRIPAFSDSDTGDFADLLALAAKLLDRPDFLYSATLGKEGLPPQQRYVSFPEGGYFLQRSGWGDESTAFSHERFLIFDCGPLGDGGHGHYDALNVEIAAYGRPLIMDPGRYTYAEESSNWRRWFKGTAAHNTVCIDHLDQTPYRRGKPKGAVAHGYLLQRYTMPQLDLLCGRVRSPVYEVIHTRWIVFVAEEYWIIVDQLSGDRPHHYDLRFHLAPEAWEQTIVTMQGNASCVRAPEVSLLLASPAAVSIESGWIAPTYGTKFKAPVVSAVVEGQSQTTFFTVIVPDHAETPLPSPQLRAAVENHPSGFFVKIDGVGSYGTACDLVAWGPTVQQFTFGRLQCRATTAWLRQSANGEDLAFRAGQVAEFTWSSSDATESITAAYPDGWIAWTQKQKFTQNQNHAKEQGKR